MSTDDYHHRIAVALERIADALEQQNPATLLTVEDAARELGIAERKIRRWIDTGLLRAMNLADDRKNLRVKRSDLTAALELRLIDARPQQVLRRRPARRPGDRY